MRCPSIPLLLAFFMSLTVVGSPFLSSPLAAQSRSKNNRQSQSKHDLDKPKTEIKVRMSKDTDTPVLILDNVGGFRMKALPGHEPTPMLQIFSDGRVLAGSKSNLVKVVAGQMDLVELQKLLVFISDDSRFFDITSEMLKADIEANQIAKIMDAPTTTLTVNLKDHSNEVQVYGLPNAPGRLARVPSVAAMIGIVSRCRKVIVQTKLGSKEETGEALAGVNKALSDKFPKVAEFTIENLRGAEQFVDGRRTASFAQDFETDGKSMLAYATREVDANGKESVTVDVIEQKKRKR